MSAPDERRAAPKPVLSSVEGPAGGPLGGLARSAWGLSLRLVGAILLCAGGVQRERVVL
jgi:hypothetical protein